MTAARTRPVVAALAVLLTLSALPAAAANGNGNGKGKGAPPSRTPVPPPPPIVTGSSTTPFAWIDDANLIAPGSMSAGFSMMHWSGDGVSETDLPVVDLAVGVLPRLQIGASFPHVVGSSDPAGAAGGLGTSYISGKIAVLEGHGMKLSAAPTLELLGAGVMQALGPDAGRAHWGVPVSIETDGRTTRVYASGGYFSRGVWFAGAGAAFQTSPRLTLSTSYSWSMADSVTPGVPGGKRNDISAGAAFAVTPTVGVYGSLGHTIATDDADGAGLTMSVGVSLQVPKIATVK